MAEIFDLDVEKTIRKLPKEGVTGILVFAFMNDHSIKRYCSNVSKEDILDGIYEALEEMGELKKILEDEPDVSFEIDD